MQCRTPCAGRGLNGSSAVTDRATFLLANQTCAPYFECAPGFFELFDGLGGAACQECGGVLPASAVWSTPGLSFNDDTSCLWECKRGQAVPDGAGGCASLHLPAVPTNQPGWFGTDEPGWTGPPFAQCPVAYTAERAAALTKADCRPCPIPPVGAAFDPTASSSVQCPWACNNGGPLRGGACPGLDPCGLAGMVPVTGSSVLCQPASLPWQPAGQAPPSGVLLSEAYSLAPDPHALPAVPAGWSVTAVAADGGCYARSRGYGTYGRHQVRARREGAGLFI